MSARTPLIACGLLLVATYVFAQPGAAVKPPDREPAKSPPQVVEIDILIADWATIGDDKQDKVDLFGPTEQVVAKVQSLEKAGKISVSRRIRLTTVAGQSAHVQLGERRPQVTGVSAVGGGGFGGGRGGGGAGAVQTSVQFTNVGTLARLTTQAYDDGKLLVEIQLERSEIDRRHEGPVLSEGSDGQKIRAEGVGTLQLQTTVALTSGETVVVSGTSSERAQEVVLLSAKLVE